VSTRNSADTLIVGGGLVGLACAAALARDGVTAIVLDDARRGSASPAAAGMLAPGVDRADAAGHAFATAARAGYPGYLDWLQGGTGIRVPLNTNGILQVALTPAGVRGLRRVMPASASWLTGPDLAGIEPILAHALGAVLHPLDGAVDNVILLEALRAYCSASALLRMVHGTARSLSVSRDGVSVHATDGSRWAARRVVLAAGAWGSAISGLPRTLPVAPARGQMIAFPRVRLDHVIFGPRGYIIPREFGEPSDRARADGETLVGATTEHVGFDSATTTDGATRLRIVASEILPSIRDVRPHRHWSGLRPMTPDLLPIIGSDPSSDALIYACGHSRNGVLMAPLTGDCVSALVRGVPAPADLSPFSIARFSR
jgi:glycine oxidase